MGKMGGRLGSPAEKGVTQRWGGAFIWAGERPRGDGTLLSLNQRSQWGPTVPSWAQMFGWLCRVFSFAWFLAPDNASKSGDFYVKIEIALPLETSGGTDNPGAPCVTVVGG